MLSCHPDPYGAFIADLQIPGCDVHLYRGANAFGCVLKDPSDTPRWWDDENAYFLGGVRRGLQKRAADRDVTMRNYFVLDFDIRKELQKRADDTAVAFDAAVDGILTALEPHPVWGLMRYATLSGNGLHIAYFGPPVAVEKESWQAGMKSVFAEINALTPLPCDTGCGNAGRIMRMPGSWNLKDSAHRKPVSVIVWMPGYRLPSLAFIQERGRQSLEALQARQEAKEEFSSTTSPADTLIDKINQIPIEQVVGQLLGCRVAATKKDGGMRFADSDNQERGFFKHKDFNIIVHEGTSLFPPPERKGYNCLSLCKAVRGCGAAEAIAWFCERSAVLREEREKEKAQWVKEHQSHQVRFFDLHILSQHSHV